MVVLFRPMADPGLRGALAEPSAEGARGMVLGNQCDGLCHPSFCRGCSNPRADIDSSHSNEASRSDRSWNDPASRREALERGACMDNRVALVWRTVPSTVSQGRAGRLLRHGRHGDPYRSTVERIACRGDDRRFG